jgi:hypothetical protein
MGEEETLNIAFAPSVNGDLGAAILALAEGGHEFESHESSTLDEGFKALDDGEADLLLASAIDIRALGGMPSGFSVAGALSLRDWNHVLVAEDRPNHLPKGAIVLSPSKLQRRQLRRLRSDCRIRSPKAHSEIAETPLPNKVAAGDSIAFINWAESLRESSDIDGYIIPRHQHRIAGLRTRRHALTAEPKEDSLIRFLPSPHAGLLLLIGRTSFPRSLVLPFIDEEGETAWGIGEILLDGIDSGTHDILGVSVRHRQPGPLLREAERRRDLMTQEALKNPEGELVDYEVKVEISLELLDRRGKATISMERLANLDEASQVARFLIGDWARFVRITSGDDAFINL